MDQFLDILLRGAVAIAAIIALTRLHGLRSFSKMSGFDFAITVAIGSVLAGAVTTMKTSIWVYIAALAALFLLQFIMSQTRARLEPVEAALDNCPLMVMENGTVIEKNLVKAGMTRADLMGKLREANAYHLSAVKAVIVEATGDVSVLHGTGPDADPEILEGVRQ